MKNQLIIFFIFFSFSISSQENNFIVGATLNFNELNTKKSNLFLKDFTYLTPANAAKQSNNEIYLNSKIFEEFHINIEDKSKSMKNKLIVLLLFKEIIFLVLQKQL